MTETLAPRRRTLPTPDHIDADWHAGAWGVLCLACGTYRSVRSDDSAKIVIAEHARCKGKGG